MYRIIAALLAATSCAAAAHGQDAASPRAEPSSAGLFTLDDAVAAAGGSGPAIEAARAGIRAAEAGRRLAGLRPNPVAQAQIENVAGTGAYSGLRGNETTVGLMQTLERGGKRSARVAAATAELSRTELQAAIVAADVRLQVTRLYVEAIAAERRLATARDQARIAGDVLRAAGIRVQAGRASPLEQQRADVARISAEANVERQDRLTRAARINLERRMGRALDAALDAGLLDRLPADAYGPGLPVGPQGTLALAAADADLAVADAEVRLARANRVPDVDVGPSLRRMEASNDFAAVFTVSIPLQVFNNGGAALEQAGARRTQAEAQRRVTALDIEQAVTDAQAEADNAATAARAAAGPALAAAQEAARIARIGYREGKFGQLDLLDAERTLAETRVSAIDALAAYQNARAQLERLTAPAAALQGGELIVMKLYTFAGAALALSVAGCGGGNSQDTAPQEQVVAEAGHADDGKVTLTQEQIASAGIQIGRPVVGGSGTLELPAIIEGDPQGTQVVSAAIGGRVVALDRNLGQSVARGQILAVIESREAAVLKGEVEASRARLALANANLAREQRLFAQRVSPEQDLIAARTAATEARIAYRQAQGQISAAGVGGGGANRLGIAAPISGQVIARSVLLGQTVDADAELYRIADLSNVSLALGLQPADAGRVKPGSSVTVIASGRTATAKVAFVSPALDPQTRLVPVMATLDNRAGQWRVGEPVTASVQLDGKGGDSAVRVPSTAVQTVAGGSVVFVRTATGFQAVPVTLGDNAGGTVIVRSGLTGRERIATVNSFTLKAELGKGEAAHED